MADKINIISINTQDARRKHNSKVNWPGEDTKEVVTKKDSNGEVINVQQKPNRDSSAGEDQFTKN